MGWWILEMAEKGPDPDPDALPLEKAIAKFRDEVTALSMDRHRGASRELAMVMTKLDEARGWAILYGETFGSHVVIPRAEILRKALPDATLETVSQT